MKLKKGDNVIVTAGKHKGATGKISTILRDANRVVIDGVNKVKKHIRPKSKTEKGSIVEREAPLHASNVMLVDQKTGKPTRIGKKMVGDSLVRFAKKSGAEIK